MSVNSDFISNPDPQLYKLSLEGSEIRVSPRSSIDGGIEGRAVSQEVGNLEKITNIVINKLRSEPNNQFMQASAQFLINQQEDNPSSRQIVDVLRNTLKNSQKQGPISSETERSGLSEGEKEILERDRTASREYKRTLEKFEKLATTEAEEPQLSKPKEKETSPAGGVKGSSAAAISPMQVRYLDGEQMREKVQMMQSYIKACQNLNPAEKRHMEATRSVLERMIDQIDLSPFEPDRFTFIELTIDGQCSGLMITYFDPHTKSFSLNDLVTAPWNVVPNVEIQLDNGKKFKPSAKKGAGGALMNEAYRLAQKNGISKVSLMSLDAEATAFYLKQGFTYTGIKQGANIPMEKRL